LAGLEIGYPQNFPFCRQNKSCLVLKIYYMKNLTYVSKIAKEEIMALPAIFIALGTAAAAVARVVQSVQEHKGQKKENPNKPKQINFSENKKK
jgi:hypothetical protein